jgi:hypothetical protein
MDNKNKSLEGKRIDRTGVNPQPKTPKPSAPPPAQKTGGSGKAK